MSSWRPITEEEFSKLFAEQYEELDREERGLFDPYRTRPWRAVIRRSEEVGDESVFIVA